MPVAADDPRLTRCGFAKLSGDGGKLDVVLRKYAVLLGRPSKGKDVDVPLEGHKAVSREHAWIRYNFGTGERRRRLLRRQLLPVSTASCSCCNALLLRFRHVFAGLHRSPACVCAQPAHVLPAHQRQPPRLLSHIRPTCRYSTVGPLCAAEQFELEVLGKNGVRVRWRHPACLPWCRLQPCPAARSPPHVAHHHLSHLAFEPFAPSFIRAAAPWPQVNGEEYKPGDAHVALPSQSLLEIGEVRPLPL